MKRKIYLGLAMLALWTGSAALAAGASTERLTVPLTDPARPAHVEVGLVMGGVKVVGAAVKEVTIEANVRDDEGDEERAAKPGRAGMKRIPNSSFGLEAEEKDNRVEISSRSWAQAVDLVVTVPAGSSLELSTVNDGDLIVEGVEGELALHNTNGEIRVIGAKGPVSAATVNGDVQVAFRANSAIAAPMAFSTLNGDVVVTLPAKLSASFRMSTTNGEIYSDFDIETENLVGPKEASREKGRYRIVVERAVAGKIGGGGPELMLKTFNGDILLKRAGG
ncbi:MAG: DUF4097 family beta strand repeat protein [Holophagales bacterium]|nr:DUF4097 family beta strand repeat protein [Holophagales bacterium]